MSKKKQKIKIVYRTPQVQKSNEAAKVKEEIRELESRRDMTQKGFKGFLQRASLNKAISDKRAFITAQDKLRAVKAQTELGHALLEKEKVKVQFKELRKKSQVNFDDLYKSPSAY